MNTREEAEEPLFPAPVRFPFAGTMKQAQVAHVHVSSSLREPGQIGNRSVRGEEPGSLCTIVGNGLADALAKRTEQDGPRSPRPATRTSYKKSVRQREQQQLGGLAGAPSENDVAEEDATILNEPVQQPRVRPPRA